MSSSSGVSLFGLGGSRARQVTEGPPIAFVGHIDHAVFALGGLLIIGWLGKGVGSESLVLEIPELGLSQKEARITRYEREDVKRAMTLSGRQSNSMAGFVCFVSLGEINAVKVPTSQQLTISVRTSSEVNGNTISSRLAGLALRDAVQSGILNTTNWSAASAAFGADRGSETTSLWEMFKSLQVNHPLQTFVESIHSADGSNLILGGWVEGAWEGTIFLIEPSLSQVPIRCDVVTTKREDVTRHLVQQGKICTSDEHGVTTAVPEGGAFKSLKFCKVTPAGVFWGADFAIEPKRASIREILASSLSTAEFAGKQVAKDHDRICRPIVDRLLSNPPTVSHIHEVGKHGVDSAVPLISIVIPFYGDAFYLLDHIVAQERVKSGVEWIYVCDDPRIANEIAKTIAANRQRIKQPTTVVYLSTNGGFAHANNIGARYARGEYLLLMNSDIYCADFSFLEHAQSILADRAEVGCIGFLLQFEDGTIQHDGMTFRLAPWFDNLWSSDHPRKGLVCDWQGDQALEVDAVSAALMMIRRRDFESGLIFDPKYIFGDFEDADLCLRLRDIGQRTLLLRSSGLYHLERQSIRHTADEHGRRAVTLLNCISFNRRWGNVLESIGVGRGQ